MKYLSKIEAEILIGIRHSNCPHCDFLKKLFFDIEKPTEGDYRFIIETFKYLHQGEDFCNYKAIEKDNKKMEEFEQ